MLLWSLHSQLAHVTRRTTWSRTSSLDITLFPSQAPRPHPRPRIQMYQAGICSGDDLGQELHPAADGIGLHVGMT